VWRVSRPKRQQRNDANARLKQEVERLRRSLAERERHIAEQAKQIAEKENQIADLERQLALRQQNSTTTSKPPSSDGLAGQQRERGRGRRSRRKPGGQPGHPGHSRPLVPIERVNAIVNLSPESCRHCQHALYPGDDVGEPRRHQVTELPPIEAQITEYRCHRRRCPACGHSTQAPLPTPFFRPNGCGLEREGLRLTFPQIRAFVQEIFTGLLMISRPQYMRWMHQAEQRFHQLRI